MNAIPDAWSINEKFILLPINKWEYSYKRIHIGGICDHSDYYNSEQLNQQIMARLMINTVRILYNWIFSHFLSRSNFGLGGIKHC